MAFFVAITTDSFEVRFRGRQGGDLRNSESKKHDNFHLPYTGPYIPPD